MTCSERERERERERVVNKLGHYLSPSFKFTYLDYYIPFSSQFFDFCQEGIEFGSPHLSDDFFVFEQLECGDHTHSKLLGQGLLYTSKKGDIIMTLIMHHHDIIISSAWQERHMKGVIKYKEVVKELCDYPSPMRLLGGQTIAEMKFGFVYVR